MIADRIIAGALAFALTIAPALADGVSIPGLRSIGGKTSVQFPPTASAPSFTGPGDIQTAVAGWGLRAYSSATRGNRVANVCNSTGGVDVGCQDMFSDPSTGLIDPATVSGITCPGTNCTVKILYDQTGNLSCAGSTACDITIAAVANRPKLSPNCIGTTLPCMVFSAASLSSANTLTLPQPFTISTVYERTGADTSNQNVVGASSGSDVLCGSSSTANKAGMFSGGGVVTAPATDGDFHAQQCFFSGGSSTFFIDGTSTSVASPGTTGFTGDPAMGVDALSNGCTCDITEGWVFTGSLGANNAILNSNQHTFWGF